MTRSRFACVAALVVFGAGCAQVPPALPGSPPVVVACFTPEQQVRAGPALVGQTYGMAMTALPLNSVQFGSPEVAHSVAIQSLFAERSASDTVQVTARLVSCLDVPAAVRVRTSFLRASTAPAEPTSGWKTVYLEPRATALYTEFSTSRDAASYLVEIAR